MKDSPKLLTVKEVASIIGVKPRTIYHWISQQVFHGAIQFGKSIRINSDVLHQYIKEHTKG
jgi:excisionase family DNA binding protein